MRLNAPAAMTVPGPSVANEFIARRSLVVADIHLAIATTLVVLVAVNLHQQLETRDSLMAAAVIAIAVGVYGWNTFNQFRDRSPVIVIGPGGLTLPGAVPTPIAWTRVRSLDFYSGLGGARIDLAVDPETYAQLKVGRRFMGDYIIRRRGWPTGFSILAHPLDRSGRAIYAAARRFWPPDDVGEGT